MKLNTLPAFIGTVFLITCVAAPTFAADPITDAISGKTVKASRGDRVTFAKNGRLTGMVGPNQDIELLGAWTIRDGRYCRTLQKPQAAAGTKCQDITVNGDGTVTIDGTNGPIVWTIQ
ncbi:MAG: hypothetical protein AAF665_20000 [Pseudomonadota bacterium]